MSDNTNQNEFAESKKEYDENREKLKSELLSLKYKNIKLTENDLKANDIYKSKIFPSLLKFNDDYYYDLCTKYKSEIESHPLFSILKDMPKGALLHNHMCDNIDVEWFTDLILNNEKFNKNIYSRYLDKSKTIYVGDRLLYTESPESNDIPIKEVIEKYLKENKDKTAYEFFHEKLSMLPDEVCKAKNNDDAWAIFMPKYFYAYQLIFYKEIYKLYLKHLFDICISEKIYHLESRLTLGKVYDENHKLIPINDEIELYKNVLNEYQKDHPDFTFGIIIEMIRRWSDETVYNTIKEAYEYKIKNPELICGLDLSGNEDNFRTFYDYSDVMKKNDELAKQYGIYIPWILHCGESIKYKNENPIDGYLLKSKRFGHGINIFKYGTEFINKLIKDNICIECNLISNQTLKQVRDLRMHPCLCYINSGLKVCLNNDDPCLYNTKGVLYDFFVAASCCEFDMLDFKLVCYNSITNSELDKEKKMKLLNKFENEWHIFICDFIKKFNDE